MSRGGRWEEGEQSANQCFRITGSGKKKQQKLVPVGLRYNHRQNECFCEPAGREDREESADTRRESDVSSSSVGDS